MVDESAKTARSVVKSADDVSLASPRWPNRKKDCLRSMKQALVKVSLLIRRTIAPGQGTTQSYEPEKTFGMKSW